MKKQRESNRLILQIAAQRLYGPSVNVSVDPACRRDADAGPVYVARIDHDFAPNSKTVDGAMDAMREHLAASLRSRASHDLAVADQLDGLGAKPLPPKPGRRS